MMVSKERPESNNSMNLSLDIYLDCSHINSAVNSAVNSLLSLVPLTSMVIACWILQSPQSPEVVGIVFTLWFFGAVTVPGVKCPLIHNNYSIAGHHQKCLPSFLAVVGVHHP